MERPIINLDSIDTYNKLYGLHTHHPLVTVIDLKDATRVVNHVTMNYGVYALFLKNGTGCTVRYGRRSYDYQEGTVVSFSPGQTVDVDMERDEVAPDVVGLMFHPDLVYGTPLADKIKTFSFFDYTEMESLHLSATEREQFMHCLEQIRHEMEHPVDHHSAALLSATIQLLIEYLHRFYDRQFITRHKVNSEVVTAFQRRLKEYFARPGDARGLPAVSYFAAKANLSAGYFSDLVRKETGTSPKDIIALHVMAEAKHRLATGTADISRIAYDLGFEYPAHFTRMFKRMTGLSPSAYRTSMVAGQASS
ncbi:MAG: helix-turn-helix domain-containing protein [Bacteroides sp.]|nr:helix-turn-helix domain-containing protein [Bacteroides sp.]MCM1095033.1 helix-turn-helix domain-containing protein [Terasakiella sp.]